jgi:pyridoxine/pyridoxamine 5'-phosphate oxidase
MAELSRADIAAMRRTYSEIPLDGLPEDPFEAFNQWLHEAHVNPVIVEANAMVLSTVDHLGEITSRTVLLKDVSQHGLLHVEKRPSDPLSATRLAALSVVCDGAANLNKWNRRTSTA